jgi:hypothetical protein
MAKAQFTLASPSVPDIIALFEQISGRKATLEERKAVAREIIEALERSRGRRLTREETWLALEQARAIGDLR